MNIREKLKYVMAAVDWEDVARWISVKDRLPELGQVVDVWHDGIGRLADCYLYDVRPDDAKPLFALWNHRFGSLAWGASVTHWMEIPAGPAPPSGEDVTSRS